MKKPKFIKEIEKSEWKERAKCWRWYIRVYWELDHKPMVELESLEIVVKELHKLEEENKKLNIKVASLEWEIKWLNSVIDKLKEENQTLELWLDNKEKVNKSLREELSAYDREYFDEDKKANTIFMEEDTLQELRDLGKI